MDLGPERVVQFDRECAFRAEHPSFSILEGWSERFAVQGRPTASAMRSPTSLSILRQYCKARSRTGFETP
jgi:hypothetical protein